LARPDARVYLPVAVGHLGLLHPFQDEADNHQAAESLLGADHGAVRPVCPDMAGAIPEGLRGRTDVAAGKSAVRERRLADVALERPAPAWVLFPERLAWSVPEKHLAQQHAAEARCKRDAGLSAA
jgi:hypothetical protein